MTAFERTKGRNAEREVRLMYEQRGFTVRMVKHGGDHLCVRNGLVIHSEVKRQERLRVAQWARQAQREAPRNAVPVVAFRQSRRDWQALLPVWGLTTVAPSVPLYACTSYSLVDVGGSWWARLPLAILLEAATV